MKYIKLFEEINIDAEKYAKIQDLMHDAGVLKYEIRDNYSIDLYEEFEMIGDEPWDELTEFPIIFNKSDSDFIWAQTKLESLKNGPKEVYSFFVYDNNLKSLEFGPTKVKGVYSYYGNGLCSGDINQIKYIPLNCLYEGNTYTFESEDGDHYFYFPYEELDPFWEQQIEKEPSIFMKLKVNKDSNDFDPLWSLKSNNISKSLYNKYKHLGRSKETNLWELK